MAACSNHVFTCSNSYPSYSTINTSVIVNHLHITQLRNAVDGAYTRIGLSPPSWSAAPTTGTLVFEAYYNELKNYINNLSNNYFGVGNIVTTVFSIGGLITAAGTLELQDDADTVRNLCYCNYNCTCNAQCSCQTDCCVYS